MNGSEVVQKAPSRGVDTKGLRSDLEALGLEIVPFTAEHAEEAARLWPLTRSLGHALETAVFVELERRGLGVTCVRTPSGYEVGYLACLSTGETEPIQVCTDPTGDAVAAREGLALCRSD
ncbi:MAG: PIN domain-containing protein [Deferrisomatales bacterium]